MAELRIRVDAGTRAEIKERAKKNGVSMNQYVSALISDYMMSPERRAEEERYANLLNSIISAYHGLAQSLEKRISENNEVLKRVMRVLEEKEERPW